MHTIAKVSLRQRRTFSEALKRKIVHHIEQGKASISQVGREYEVSATAIYTWLNRYSRNLHSDHAVVVQMKSEAYMTKELQKRIQELEAALGRKQMEIDLLNMVIEVGSAELGMDLKKNFSSPPSTGSGKSNGKKGTK